MRPTLILACLAFASPLTAQQLPRSNPLIDYAGFKDLTGEVQPYRSTRLISMTDFKARIEKGDVLLLDARSARAFAEGHIKGAVNLPLPDFTAEALAEAIGTNADREILIYCNNNFINNRRPVATKALPLALNIQTFINLYGYGYKNIFELGEAVDMDDPSVGWVSAET
jgi:phage shock protein E